MEKRKMFKDHCIPILHISNQFLLVFLCGNFIKCAGAAYKMMHAKKLGLCLISAMSKHVICEVTFLFICKKSMKLCF